MGQDDRTVIFHLPTGIFGQLVCLEGSVAGRTWELSAGTFVIGRQDGADLHLPREPGVSKVHAKIVAEGDLYTLIDHESRNGTIVNGKPARRATLRDGDEIRICGCLLRFSQGSGADPHPSSSPVRSAPIATEPAQRDFLEEERRAFGREAPVPSHAAAPSFVAEGWPPASAESAARRVPRAQDPTVLVKHARDTGSASWFLTGLLFVLLVASSAYLLLRFVFIGESAPAPPPQAAAPLSHSPALAHGEIVAEVRDGELLAPAVMSRRDAGEADAGRSHLLLRHRAGDAFQRGALARRTPACC